MFESFRMPPTGFGPGSQPDEGGLDYLAMPSGMRTYAHHLPEVEAPDRFAPALALLADAAAACREAAALGAGRRLPLGHLDAENRRLLAETLGEGEVACQVAGEPPARAQEAVFAGVWTVSAPGVDRIEVGPVPQDVAVRAFDPVTPAIGPLAPRGPGVVNAPALVSELMDRSAAWGPGTAPHVVNLTLLPHTPEDLGHLDTALGRGSATLLSRGYGNCRVEATALRNVWRVRFFNSMDSLILDTFEVANVPEVALAAREDFADSAARIDEILEAIR